MSLPILRAKMRVAEVTHHLNESGDTETEKVRLVAVFGENGSDNERWSRWTPAADFSISISNPPAMKKLARGHEFFVDFTPVDKDQE